MGFTVEQDCPQCGAPIQLEETDRILRCPYCGVKSYLFAPGYFRLVLPHRSPGEEIFYAPYLRFKGNVYYCDERGVGYRIVDITSRGLSLKGIPASLGLRPQTMRMRFVGPDITGSFLRFSLKAADIVARASRLSSSDRSGKILHRAYIGETLSLIYLPLFLKGNRLFDAVLNRPIAGMSPGGREAFDAAVKKNPRWELTFLPTLCPRCGWEMTAERDSVVLTCGNCENAWEASDTGFAPVKCRVVQGRDENSLYLPFWKITAEVEGIQITSFADFIRVTNQPRVIGREWENDPMNFWSPAFKIRPKVFLNLARQFTISQEHFHSEPVIPEGNLYPVTLPRGEAAQAMKVILADSAVTRRNVFPHLPGVRFRIRDSALVYLPFTEKGYEIIQDQMGISINKNTLVFGRRM